MADDGHPLDVEHRQQVAHPVGVGRHRVVGARLVGLPSPSRSGAMTVNRWASLACTVFHVVELSPMPWINRIAGPDPAMR